MRSRRGPAEHRSAAAGGTVSAGFGQPASPLSWAGCPRDPGAPGPGWRLLSPADPAGSPAVWVLRAAPRGGLRAAASPGFPRFL